MENAVLNYWFLSYNPKDPVLFERLLKQWDERGPIFEGFEYCGPYFARKSKGEVPELSLISSFIFRGGLLLEITPRELKSGINALDEVGVRNEFIEEIKKVYAYLEESPPDGFENEIEIGIIGM